MSTSPSSPGPATHLRPSRDRAVARPPAPGVEGGGPGHGDGLRQRLAVDPLWRAVRLLDVNPRRAALAVLLGVAALGSAVALAAVSAWLITRAAQMPPVLELSVATVAVRAFGIGRGLFRYLERLVSHDVALRGMSRLRTTLYRRLAEGRAEATLGLRRGDLLARVGADVDAVGDVVVRGLLPAAVAAVLGLGTVVAMALLLPAAGLTLAVCLLLAGVVAPWLAQRAARTTELRAAAARAEMAATALGLLEDAGPLAVQGRTGAELSRLRSADADLAAATDSGAGPAAVAAALGTLAVGLAVVAALLVGVPAVTAGTLAPVELAVVVLTPLAAFEATSVLPAAAIQVHRSRAAAQRLVALLDDAAGPEPAAGAGTAPGAAATLPRPASPAGSSAPGAAPAGAPGTSTPATVAPTPAVPGGPHLTARGLAVGWPGREPVVTGLDLDLSPGRSVAVVGPSGVGKTTLLLTLAGMLPIRGGELLLDGVPLAAVDPALRLARLALTTEDAHVFETTVLENLRVARGDATAQDAEAALERSGLGDWLAGLPDGVDTALGPDARSVSGGERRRLLLARSLLATAPLLLVDEPAEHLDPVTADRLVRDLLGTPRTAGSARGVLLVTHRLAPLGAADEVVVLREGRVAARGTHAYLLDTDAHYRVAHATEQHDSGAQTWRTT
ncbi:thiol reductant ABC exporter subunit CydC [Cellulomonas sp. C5510]|uniref:thiol reductant ABC exporter subunit CydC n=1 Tax=Cellulomonas sp. C5510 TaxID=2871170 RepID=UPI001C95658F|nr:thiol reductant ABC exporter subunit CydC [Cellulomonas sp. C5510]QZN86644.1 thiol reductant ABC exporter subunit CydC [Cellulomonas sp. C5510]